MTTQSTPSRDWDDAFNNMGHVAGSEKLPGQWQAEATAYRDATQGWTCDIAYGDAPRERLDLLRPEGAARGLAIFIHGGFWMRLDKSYWSHLAEGARANGWAVAIPSYTLAPEARISEMTRQMALAVTRAAAEIDGPIRLAGHSAGGHLVTRLICGDSTLPSEVLSRITGVTSISGLHDLRPLMHTAMNDTLHLDPIEAAAESAALQTPHPGQHLTCWVGGGERPEFIRQSQLLALMWEGLDTDCRLKIDGDHNHFTVLEDLRRPDSPITRAWLGT